MQLSEQQVAAGAAVFERTKGNMAMSFTPPVIVPLGLIAITAACAIYHAFAYPPPRMLTAAAGASRGVKTAGSQHLGGIR